MASSSQTDAREVPDDPTRLFDGDYAARVMQIVAERQAEAAESVQRLERLVVSGAWDAICPPDPLKCLGEVNGLACPACDRCPHAQARADHRRRSYLSGIGFGGEELNPTFERLPEEFRHSVRVYAETLDERIEAGEGFVFAGGTGAGKTCSLAYMAWALHRRGLEVSLVQSPTMFRLLDSRRSWNREIQARADASLSRWCEVPVLMVDEFGMEGRTTEAMAGFHAIANERVNRRLLTFLATNLNEDDARAGGTDEDLSRAFERLAMRNPYLWTARVSQRRRASVAEWAAGQKQLEVAA